MTAVIIGISAGILIILTIAVLKQLNKQLIYGLILSGIGFLYIGFTWTDMGSVIMCSMQSILFLLIAYYGITKSLLLLAVGYILHGIWDLVFNLFPYSKIIPPHYDLFCLSIDFIIGFYLIVIRYRSAKTVSLQ